MKFVLSRLLTCSFFVFVSLSLSMCLFLFRTLYSFSVDLYINLRTWHVNCLCYQKYVCTYACNSYLHTSSLLCFSFSFASVSLPRLLFLTFLSLSHLFSSSSSVSSRLLTLKLSAHCPLNVYF